MMAYMRLLQTAVIASPTRERGVYEYSIRSGATLAKRVVGAAISRAVAVTAMRQLSSRMRNRDDVSKSRIQFKV